MEKVQEAWLQSSET